MFEGRLTRRSFLGLTGTATLSAWSSAHALPLTAMPGGGKLVLPGDPRYGEARMDYNSRFS